MSDDTPEELKKFRFTSGESMRFAEPYLVESKPICRVETWSDGQRHYKTEHEPDEELERAVYVDDTKFIILFKRKTEEKIATVRVCKHCGCVYVEKPKESVTMKEATGYTLSELKEKADERNNT